MKYFSVPADFKIETLQEYHKLNQQFKTAKVFETYGNLTKGYFIESGRSLENLPLIDLELLKKYIEEAQKLGIGFNYTLNASHMQNREFSNKGIMEIKNLLFQLFKIGVRSLTIAMPSLIELVKSTGLDFSIKASTICQITNSNKALSYKNMGVSRIVIDESLNRDFIELKSIRNAFGPQVELIVNSVCHKNCIYRMFHYNQVSSDSTGVLSQASENYYSHRCVLQRMDTLGGLLKLSWIRPEDIKHYYDIGISYFKLQGRHSITKRDTIKTLRYYMQEDYDGNLGDLLDMFYNTNSFKVIVENKKLDGFLKPFIEDKEFCKNDCTNCGYCEGFMKKSVDLEKTKNTLNLAKDFYIEYDQYNALLNPKDTTNEAGQETSIDFDFD